MIKNHPPFQKYTLGKHFYKLVWQCKCGKRHQSLSTLVSSFDVCKLEETPSFSSKVSVIQDYELHNGVKVTNIHST